MVDGWQSRATATTASHVSGIRADDLTLSSLSRVDALLLLVYSVGLFFRYQRGIGLPAHALRPLIQFSGGEEAIRAARAPNFVWWEDSFQGSGL